MKIYFKQDSLQTLNSVIKIMTLGLRRDVRRNMLRLANKFTPTAQHVYLKPKDREFLIAAFLTATEALTNQVEKLDPVTQADDRTKVQAFANAAKYALDVLMKHHIPETRDAVA